MPNEHSGHRDRLPHRADVPLARAPLGCIKALLCPELVGGGVFLLPVPRVDRTDRQTQMLARVHHTGAQYRRQVSLVAAACGREIRGSWQSLPQPGVPARESSFVLRRVTAGQGW